MVTPMDPVPLFHRFSFKIIAGLILMLFLVGLPFFFVFLSYHRNQLLETMENATMNMSRVLTNQLEVSVLERRNHELPRVVERLTASRGGVRRIMVVDSIGKVVASSDTFLVGRTLSRYQDAGCRECHESVTMKDSISLTDSDGTPYYRNVTVIQNRPACFGCHGSTSPVAGILVMDFSQESLQAQFHSSLLRLILMAAAMLVLTIGVLYVLLHRLVLRRLRRFAEAAEQIGPDRFGSVIVPGGDEFSQLATSFNLMSQRLESAMKEIREAKDYLESVINDIDDEIVVLDRDYEVVTANAAYMRNSCCPHDTGSESARPLPHPYETCACTSTFSDGQVHKVLQTVLRSDGKERYMEVFSSPLRDEAGEVHQVVEVRRDITERKLLEANLAHSERLISLGLLASGLSHEINNPLASISTFVEGLKRRLEDSGKESADSLKGLEYSLGLIQREIDRARDITRRLLILSQKDSAGSSLVDLNESLRETVQLVRYEARKRRMDIQLDLTPGIPILKLAESQARQVFLNLLLNSLQAGHEGGAVVCRTWRENGRVFAAVQDDGIGIESSELVKVFEPFFSNKAPGQGTGLGLFICKSIVSSWGGSIDVESRAGHGATFTLWIPIQS
jgi:signal transduction histidine kinase